MSAPLFFDLIIAYNIRKVKDAESIFICDIYARLSHEEKESESIENQIKAAKEFIKAAENIVLNDIKCDDGYSGVDFNRPAFNEMMEDIKNGNINCVIVKDLSRLGRDYINTGRYIEEIFPMYNVRFIAVNDRIDTADKDHDRNDIMIPFKNLINEFYVRDISVKTKSSLRVKMKRGEIISAFAPYGYTLCNKHFEPDHESAETVRWIFEMYLRGYSCKNIAEKLNFARIKSPNEYKKYKGENYKCGFDTGMGLWHYNTVRRILKNEVYCGELIQGKRKRISYKVKKNVKVEKEMQIRADKEHRGIIEKEIFAAVERVLENDNRCSVGRNRVYVLSGVMY